jgi:hypothetical protein
LRPPLTLSDTVIGAAISPWWTTKWRWGACLKTRLAAGSNEALSGSAELLELLKRNPGESEISGRVLEGMMPVTGLLERGA